MGLTVKKVGDWDQAAKLLKVLPSELDAAIQTAVMGEAEYLRGQIVKQFGRVKPALSPLTVKTRGGGSKPLQRTGNLKGSIGVVQKGKHEAFVGVPASSAGARLADIHENGRVITMRMTDKMRKFLHAALPEQVGPRLPSGAFGSSDTGILVIHIPPRPFVAPVWEREQPKIPKRFMARILTALGGKLGTPEGGAEVGGPSPVAGAGGGGGGVVGGKVRDYSAAAKKGWATRRGKGK